MKNSLLIKNFLFHTGIMKGLRTLFPNKGIPILRYHAIVSPENNDYASPSISLSPDLFENHIRYFSRNYKIISLDTVADCIENQKDFPAKSLIITFDDGYKDNYTAYRILKKYQATATFYIAAGCIDNASPLWLFEVIYLIRHTQVGSIRIRIKDEKYDFPLNTGAMKRAAVRSITEFIKSNNLKTREDIRKQLRDQIADVRDFDEKSAQVMLSWDQVREMAENKMTIAGHTMTHLNLPNAEPEDALFEIQACKTLIEEKINKPVVHFSYPNGGNYDYYNESIKAMVRQAGYRTSTTSKNGLSFLSSDQFELERIRVTPHLSEIEYQIGLEPVLNNRKGIQ